MNKPSPEEIEQAAAILSRLERGLLPLSIFLEVTRLMPTLTIELAPVRKNVRGDLEIFLTQRPDDDPNWPSQWHIPGTVVRSTDEMGSFKTGFERILKDEAAGLLALAGDPVQVATHFWDIARGCEYDVVHYVPVECLGEEGMLPGKFFAFDALPENIIEHHPAMIKEIMHAIATQQA